MLLLLIISFLFAAGGSLLLLDLSPFSFWEGLAGLKPKDTSLKKQIRNNQRKKAPKGIKRMFLEVKEILRLTGKNSQFTAICILSILLFILGLLLAAAIKNIFLVPVLSAGMAFLPFCYILFTANRYKKQMHVELETALSMISTSYLRNRNTFIRAVKENVPYLNPPVSELFRDFLMQVQLINSNMEEALEHLKAGSDNDVFREWVDAVEACQEDHNLKSTLPPIAGKLSDMRVVSAELDLLLYEPVKEYITMLLLLVGSIPLLYFLNRDWYDTLMFTTFGKILLAICGTVIFVSLGAVSRHIRPIEYKR